MFVYTLAQIVELFHTFPVISATTCYYLYISWVLIDMYIIHLFPDGAIAVDFIGERAGVMAIDFDMGSKLWAEAINDALAAQRANRPMEFFTHLKELLLWLNSKSSCKGRRCGQYRT